jgi:hypothetical protein
MRLYQKASWLKIHNKTNIIERKKKIIHKQSQNRSILNRDNKTERTELGQNIERKLKNCKNFIGKPVENCFDLKKRKMGKVKLVLSLNKMKGRCDRETTTMAFGDSDSDTDADADADSDFWTHHL